MKAKFTVIQFGNYDIEFKKVTYSGKESHYCVYVLLPDSQNLDSRFLGDCWVDVSYRGREGVDDDHDNVGIDTNHSWNQGMTMDEKLLDGLKQISVVIKQYEYAMKGKFRYDPEEEKD
jgi:hypothetical protein